MNALKSYQKDASYMPDNDTLKQIFEDANTHKIKPVLHQTTKSITVSSILIFISLLLFILHWTWLRKINRMEQ